MHQQLNCLRVGFFLAVIFAGGLASLAKTIELFPNWFNSVEHGMGGDGILHFSVATLLGFSACWAGEPTSYRRLDIRINKPQWISLALCLFGVTVDEALQALAPTRTLALSDWVANVTGVMAGVVVYQATVICRRWLKPIGTDQ